MFFVSSLLIDPRETCPTIFMSKVLRHIDMLGIAHPHFQLPCASIHTGWLGVPSALWFWVSISSPASSLKLTYFFSYLNSPDVVASALCAVSLLLMSSLSRNSPSQLYPFTPDLVLGCWFQLPLDQDGVSLGKSCLLISGGISSKGMEGMEAWSPPCSFQSFLAHSLNLEVFCIQGVGRSATFVNT